MVTRLSSYSDPTVGECRSGVLPEHHCDTIEDFPTPESPSRHTFEQVGGRRFCIEEAITF
jgi:hypothetical protein